MSSNGLLVFNNSGPSNGSAILKFSINGGSANLDWTYSPGLTSNTWGSAKELPKGNVLADFSNNNVIHELTSGGQLIQSTSVSGIAYVVRRASLYGPPPPWDR